jgi:hypothetical protein
MNTQDTFLKSGYTHLIEYNELLEWANIFVQKSFPTTADAVQIHLDSLNARRYNKHGDEMIVGIKAITL